MVVEGFGARGDTSSLTHGRPFGGDYPTTPSNTLEVLPNSVAILCADTKETTIRRTPTVPKAFLRTMTTLLLYPGFLESWDQKKETPG